MKVEFEWHKAKAEANLQAHGVSFELGATVFNDPLLSNVLTIVKTMERTVLSSSVWQRNAFCCL